jgi:Ser/Thr protein kinase RdoA (MazF antagonist)
MLDISADKEYPLSAVHPDVTNSNARWNKYGRLITIDLDDLMSGPAEFSLGRPLGQWTKRFGRPPILSQSLLNGYEAHAPRQIDPDILTRALQVSEIKYAAVSLKHLVHTLESGYEPDVWNRQQGVSRLINLDTDEPWVSREKFVKR